MTAQHVSLVASRFVEWSTRYDDLRMRLALVLPDADVQHIGSTAVPAMPSKDVVDVLVGVGPKDIDAAAHALVDAGFDLEGTRPGHSWLSVPDRARRVAVIHVMARDGSRWRDRIDFRDLLIADADARTEYLRVKREAAEHASGWSDYTAAKHATVTRLLSGHRST